MIGAQCSAALEKIKVRRLRGNPRGEIACSKRQSGAAARALYSMVSAPSTPSTSAPGKRCFRITVMLRCAPQINTRPRLQRHPASRSKRGTRAFIGKLHVLHGSQVDEVIAMMCSPAAVGR